MTTVGRSRYELVPADDPRLEGRLCKEVIEGDTFVVLVAEGELTKALCGQINGYLDLIAESGWPSGWGDSPDGLVIAECRFEFVPGGALPRGRMCHAIPSPAGEFIWLIREGQMSEACRMALNEMVGRAVDDGLRVRPGQLLPEGESLVEKLESDTP